MLLARPCYLHLEQKMSGPQSMIAIQGSRDVALSCEKSAISYAAADHGPELHIQPRSRNSTTIRRKLIPTRRTKAPLQVSASKHKWHVVRPNIRTMPNPGKRKPTTTSIP